MAASKDRSNRCGALAALVSLAACATPAPQPPPAGPIVAPPPAAVIERPSSRDPDLPPRPEETLLYACKMSVINAPPHADDRRIAGARKSVTIRGVTLLLAPVTDGCLSSGFGPRGSRTHKGVDYFSRTGDAIAAGDGVILEALSRRDFGNMILIDHGGGVFTRYGHLAKFARDFADGDTVRTGERLGRIGATGQARAPHLHYEILTGDYLPRIGSFGLTSHDPFVLLYGAECSGGGCEPAE